MCVRVHPMPANIHICICIRALVWHMRKYDCISMDVEFILTVCEWSTTILELSLIQISPTWHRCTFTELSIWGHVAFLFQRGVRCSRMSGTVMRRHGLQLFGVPFDPRARNQTRPDQRVACQIHTSKRGSNFNVETSVHLMCCMYGCAICRQCIMKSCDEINVLQFVPQCNATCGNAM